MSYDNLSSENESLAWRLCSLFFANGGQLRYAKTDLLSEPEDVLPVVFIWPPPDAVYVFCGEEVWSAEHRGTGEDDGRFFGHKHGRFHSIR